MEDIRKTIENDEEFLRQVSTDVNLESDNFMEWIQKIKDYCRNNLCYALASVQIGIPKRLIYLRNTSLDVEAYEDLTHDEEQVLINPVIISQKGHTRFLEACVSCLGYSGTVDRPYQVEVEYYKTTGEKVRETFEGFKATVFCHEYDHLNGILHIDLAKDIREMTYEERKEYRLKHPYEVLSKDGEFHTIK